MISVNIVVTVPGVLKRTYEGVTFHRALFILNDLFGDYGDTVQYMVFNGETGEAIESVDLNRVCQSVYKVSDMIELVPYVERYERVTTLDGYVLWDRT